jgi:hypothetical protein
MRPNRSLRSDLSMTPIALTDAQLREIQTIALGVPHHLRSAFLQEVATMLRDKGDLGDGVINRVCRAVAHQLIWDAARSATG